VKQLRDVRVWIGLGVTGLCLWLAMRGVSFEELARDMARANWWVLLAGSIPAHVLALYLRALRWRHLTNPIQSIATAPLFRATAVGFMANNLIPLRVGEVIRAWYLARETGLSGTALFGTVILERVIDSAVFLGLVAVIVGVYGLRLGSEGMAVGIPLLGLLSAPMAFVVALRFWPEPATRLSAAVVRPVSEPLAVRIEAAVGRFAEGLGAISRGGHLFWIALHSVLIWLVISVLPFWAAIVALDIDLGSVGRTLAASYVLLTAVGIAVAVPSAPGFFGPYHLACRAALGRFGVPESAALAMGTLTHAIFWVTVTLLGLVVLRVRHTPLAELEDHARVEDLSPSPGTGKDPGSDRR
jgi:uncharacterized protein (TIRG00374 family)